MQLSPAVIKFITTSKKSLLNWHESFLSLTKYQKLSDNLKQFKSVLKNYLHLILSTL